MKPIYQTRIGYPNGNCLAACLASIFELDIKQVPHFGTDPFWYDKFISWSTRTLGLKPIDIEIAKSDWIPSGYHIINGPSLNGDFWHSVVGKNGEVVHDPNPNGPSLKEPRTWTVFVKIIGDQLDMYKFFYNKSLPLLRITFGKQSIALQVGPRMAEFLYKLVEGANRGLLIPAPGDRATRPDNSEPGIQISGETINGDILPPSA